MYIFKNLPYFSKFSHEIRFYRIYKYYINGEEQGQTEKATDIFEFNNLETNKKYTIYVEIRDKETNAYKGSILKQITTIEPNKPELTGFDTKYTRYLTINEKEKLTT